MYCKNYKEMVTDKRESSDSPINNVYKKNDSQDSWNKKERIAL